MQVFFPNQHLATAVSYPTCTGRPQCAGHCVGHSSGTDQNSCLQNAHHLGEAGRICPDMPCLWHGVGGDEWAPTQGCGVWGRWGGGAKDDPLARRGLRDPLVLPPPEEQGCPGIPQVCGQGTVDSQLQVLLITEKSQAGMTGGVFPHLLALTSPACLDH